MTFLGEWGDRSQIATIAMAAGQDYWWVTGGAIAGHCICTGIAVIGGRALAGKVSLRVGKYNPSATRYMNSKLTQDSHSWRSNRFPCFRCHLLLRGFVRLDDMYTSRQQFARGQCRNHFLVCIA